MPLMFRIVALLLLFIHLPAEAEEPFRKAYEKQVVKELTAWSATFAKFEHVRTAGVREFYKIISKSGTGMGTLVLTSAQGRFEKFDLMVLVDRDGHIALIRVLRYRSEYGSEVTNKKWLSQFYSKTENSFVLHKNIDAISGATYSSNGVVDEINMILTELKHP